MNNNILDSLVNEAKKEVPQKVADKKNVIPEDNSVMGKLLQVANIDFPEIGNVLDGVVIDISPHSVLLDLGSFGTGIVYGKDTRDGLRGNTKLKLGDEVHATLTSLENEDGYIELSIREASYEKAWEDLESKKDNEEAVDTRVLDANKGGLMVEINGIGGFLPVSQLASEHYPRVEDGNKNKILEKLKRLVGQTLLVKIIDTYRDEEKLIVSEKAAMSEKEQVMISRLKEGDTIEGEVSGVVDFGAFIKFLPAGVKEGDASIEGDKLEGLVHISELAWQLIDNPREIIKVGDRIKAKIIGIDEARISLSIRALAQDPWKEAQKKYEAGKTYTGKVDKINHFGAFVYLDANIHGLAHVSEFSEMYPGKKMEEMMEAGKEYSWKVLSIEPKDHRMGLVLVDASLEIADKKEKKSTKKEKAVKEEKEEAGEKKVVKKSAKKETVKKEASSAKATADEKKVSDK